MATPFDTVDAGPVLIAGAGLAGLFTALMLGKRQVTLLTASPLGSGAASAWAQGGIAAAMSADDSPANHADDTCRAGAGLVDTETARAFCRQAPQLIEDLLALGVPFDRTADGKLMLGREAGHSHARIVRVKGDAAGAAIIATLADRVRARPNITVIEGWKAFALIRAQGSDRIGGLFAADAGGRVAAFRAGSTVLALGGSGGLFQTTTNPAGARGVALAMAARDGLAVRDPEFVQFHPTAIACGRDPAPLATEALRGDGATLIDERGERFMMDIHPHAELAPRDVVARAIFRKLQSGGRVFLDTRHAIGSAMPERFPTVFAACMAAGIDPRVEAIPVAPAAHYHMGGLAADRHGRVAGRDGLFAAGECASTGFHGGNRLASNSLLEAVALGRGIAEAVDMSNAGPLPSAAPVYSRDTHSAAQGLRKLRALMTQYCGVERDGAGLARAAEGLAALKDEAMRDTEFDNALLSAKLIVAGAIAREESRGGHYRTEHPLASPFARHTLLTGAQAEQILARQTESAAA